VIRKSGLAATSARDASSSASSVRCRVEVDLGLPARFPGRQERHERSLYPLPMPASDISLDGPLSSGSRDHPRHGACQGRGANQKQPVTMSEDSPLLAATVVVDPITGPTVPNVSSQSRMWPAEATGPV